MARTLRLRLYYAVCRVLLALYPRCERTGCTEPATQGRWCVEHYVEFREELEELYAE